MGINLQDIKHLFCKQPSSDIHKVTKKFLCKTSRNDWKTTFTYEVTPL